MVSVYENQDSQTAIAIGSKSYNTLMGELVALETTWLSGSLLLGMGKSLRKWIKTVFFGKKASRSNSWSKRKIKSESVGSGNRYPKLNDTLAQALKGLVGGDAFGCNCIATFEKQSLVPQKEMELFQKNKHSDTWSLVGLSLSSQVLDFYHFEFSFMLDSLEHATMFLHLAIYAGIALVVKLTHLPEVFMWFVGLLAASVFSQELFLLHFHSTDHVGPEGVLVFEHGIHTMGPEICCKGCMVSFVEGGNDMHGAVTCGTNDAFLRARALANLQFSLILAAIMILTSTLCLTLAGKYIARRQSIEYERIHSRGADANQIPMDV
ncbi:hypothetical protein IFM89_037928 [Coptis chinensis]|uniref:Uncharacterized protein n=1 Tax=Coptis chinensis TaxID=261450 RepID=A0A835HQU7_9MAGN|nr:hypothetical protein IFM89_037928 [Coptis chinensis]